VDVYKPDIVVFHVFADNDFGDLIRNRLFTFDPSGALVKFPHPQGIDPCLRQFPCLAGGAGGNRVKNFIASLLTVRAGNMVLAAAGVLKPPSDPTPEAVIEYSLAMAEREYLAYQGSRPGPSSHFIDEYDYDLALFPERESSKAKVKLMDAVLRKANQFAQAKHVKFMVLVQPSSRDLTANLRPNYMDFSSFSGYGRTNLTSAVERIGKANNIHVLNLFEPFSKNTPDRLFFLDNDDHWTNAGQKLAAHEVASYIRAMFLTR
jgi:hypothetical protein